MSESFDWPVNYPDPTKYKKQQLYRRVIFLFVVMFFCCASGILIGMLAQSARMSDNKEDIRAGGGDATLHPSNTPLSLSPSSSTAHPTIVAQKQIPTTSTQNQYQTFVILQEEANGQVLPLEAPLGMFGNFVIVPEGDRLYLWINSFQNKNLPRQGIEQRLESIDGLLWFNRKDTNLQQVDGDPYKYLTGLRTIIKQDNTYQGWEMYYYESSKGWADAIRYVTSSDGLNWQIHNQPTLRGAKWGQVLYANGVYQMWVHTNVDLRLYPSEREVLRFRISEQPGSGWGDWQFGGNVVSVDQVPLTTQHFVRYINGKYEIYYREDTRIYRAVGNDGISFTLEESVLDVAYFLPGVTIGTFAVETIRGDDRFYFTYRDASGKWGMVAAMPIH